jgi:hypothetical protein
MGGIINKKKLRKLRREIEALRAGIHNVRPRDLIRLALQLGRELDDRGKHPTYVSTLIPNSNPLSIPGHPTIKPTTAKSILDELEADIDRHSSMIEDQERKNDTKRLPAPTLHESDDSR